VAHDAFEVGGRNAPHFVSTVEELEEIVRVVQEHGAFVFDVETYGAIDRHPDVEKWIEKEWQEHLATLKTTNDDVLARAREIIVGRWKNTLALDPLRNSVFWIAIATEGRSWAIPMGHPNGEVIVPEERGDGSTVPPPGYRKFTASGKESMAKARYFKPAVFSPAPKQLTPAEVFESLRPLFFSDIVKIGHNVKFDARSVRKYFGGDLPEGPFLDTMLMQHIVNENLMEYNLAHLISHNFEGFSAYHRDGKLGAFITEVSFSKALHYVHLDARWTWLLYKALYKKVTHVPELLNSLRQDMQVLRVIMEMEDTGIPVNQREMTALGKRLEVRLNEILLDLNDYAPPGFNPDSSKHKQQLLFNKKREGGLGLKSVKTTPGGNASVDEEALHKLETKHPVVPMLLEWAETKKLVTTYVDGLLPKLHNGRLHPSFHLHRTATGRLSSSNPNLQNIPRDSTVRNLFRAPAGYELLVADYDQIELRVMCMFSHDPKMSEFFLTGEDIHSGAAALVLGKDVSEVTAEERQLGKGVNFLTAYGGGAQKLARTTGIDEDHAKHVIDQYYRQFSGITKWKQEVIAEGRSKGYVSTISGRRRHLPDLCSSDNNLKARAERQAVNAVVQGSAADICKKAMIDVYEALSGLEANMLVQVHDELVVMTRTELSADIFSIMINAMGDGVVYEGIPLKVSGHAASSWAEAKGK
jgi:DNA polymerase I-like protein with 3'-5' exonuclease and polymerase domains